MKIAVSRDKNDFDFLWIPIFSAKITTLKKIIGASELEYPSDDYLDMHFKNITIKFDTIIYKYKNKTINKLK